MIHPLIQAAEAPVYKPDDQKLAPFGVGDDVDVMYRIVEGEGVKQKTRTQRFTGVVIQIRGRGPTRTFTVRRIVAGSGVERVFPYESPNVESVVVKRSGRTRRARLFYLRDRVGKATRLVEKKDARTSKAQGGGSGGTASKAKADKGAQKRAQAENKKQEMADSPEVHDA